MNLICVIGLKKDMQQDSRFFNLLIVLPIVTLELIHCLRIFVADSVLSHEQDKAFIVFSALNIEITWFEFVDACIVRFCTKPEFRWHLDGTTGNLTQKISRAV